MRIRLIAAALLCANTAVAEDIAGIADTDFVSAKDLWLTGTDDIAALGALSALANDGNRAAQILIARIETRPVLHQHVTGTLERADRIALLRKPGGLSGKSWMTDAATDTPLAAAFVAIRGQDTRADGAVALLDLQEIDAALLPLKDQLNYGAYDLVLELLEHPNVPAHAGVLRSYAWGAKAASEGISMPIITFPLAYKLEWDIWSALENEPPPDITAEAIKVIPEVIALQPFAAICETHCPETTATCTYALALKALANTSPMATLASPVETIISTNTYQTSGRFETDIKRHMQTQSIPAIDTGKMDRCAADYLQE